METKYAKGVKYGLYGKANEEDIRENKLGRKPKRYFKRLKGSNNTIFVVDGKSIRISNRVVLELAMAIAKEYVEANKAKSNDKGGIRQWIPSVFKW